MSHAVGFLGAGNMATALAIGWKNAGLIDGAASRAFDPYHQAAEKFPQATGIAMGISNADVVKTTSIVVLAVKPQTMTTVLYEICDAIGPNHLVVSIAAGITIQKLADGLPRGTRIVRVMPNTPCLVGASATGIAAGPTATADDLNFVQSLFESVGVAVKVPEHLLNAVTGLSGSGPAYVAVMIEALADGGVRAGLPRDIAMSLATQTVLGTAKMVLETKQHPAQLKDAVASPGGTTIAGLHALERAGVRAGLIDAVLAATQRANELGK